MKILIVDDHAIFRDGLKRILSEEFEGATFVNYSNRISIGRSVKAVLQAANKIKFRM